MNFFFNALKLTAAPTNEEDRFLSKGIVINVMLLSVGSIQFSSLAWATVNNELVQLYKCKIMHIRPGFVIAKYISKTSCLKAKLKKIFVCCCLLTSLRGG